MSPQDAMVYLQPRLSAEEQHGCWPPVIEQELKCAAQELPGMNAQATDLVSLEQQ
jgi:hypothetical protein